MRSCLARFIPDPMDAERIKREAWQEEKILVLSAEQLAQLPNKEHQIIVGIGNRIYGGKHGK